MQPAHDPLAAYELARQRLRQELTGRLPACADLEGTITAYAYWVCTGTQRPGAEWEATVRRHVDLALARAGDEAEAERLEITLLRRHLAERASSLLDVGAGWGRLAPLYEEAGLRAVYVEPEPLGVRLMQRAGLAAVQALGERLPFAGGAFATIVMGWVLHHGQKLDAAAIVRQVARVAGPAGLLLSIEPLGFGFDEARWTALLGENGFRVRDVQVYHTTAVADEESERYALAVAEAAH